MNDSSKRELYDRYGSSFEQYAGNPRGGGSTRGSQGTAGAEGFDFSQFFGERYGGDSTGGFADIFSQFRRADAGGNTRGRRARKSRGSDIEHRVPIPFATASMWRFARTHWSSTGTPGSLKCSREKVLHGSHRFEARIAAA